MQVAQPVEPRHLRPDWNRHERFGRDHDALRGRFDQLGDRSALAPAKAGIALGERRILPGALLAQWQAEVLLGHLSPAR